MASLLGSRSLERAYCSQNLWKMSSRSRRRGSYGERWASRSCGSTWVGRIGDSKLRSRSAPLPCLPQQPKVLGGLPGGSEGTRSPACDLSDGQLGIALQHGPHVSSPCRADENPIAIPCVASNERLRREHVVSSIAQR